MHRAEPKRAGGCETQLACTQLLGAADAVSQLATSALEREVMLTPKPGLVDTHTIGAHDDMDVSTFFASASALSPHFVACARLGLTQPAHLASPMFIERLRAIGRDGETAMFAATGGVNTHKGANYSFSLVLAATGMELAAGASLPFGPAASARVLSRTADIGRAILAQDLGQLRGRDAGRSASGGLNASAGRSASGGRSASDGRNLSHGERLFLKRGVTGVRGESAAGYPVLAEYVLPYLRTRAGAEPNDTLLRATLLIMATLEDTNLLHRGGPDGLAWVRKQARRVWEADFSHDELMRALSELDAALTKRNLSPGGTADMLSLGIYFAMLEGLLD